MAEAVISELEGKNNWDKPQRNRTRSPPRRPEVKTREETSMNVTVPEKLVARLIGKRGDNVKNIMQKTGCRISF